MISAKMRDPESKLEFMEFTHGTTCIVGVPHGAESELWLSSNRACTLTIEASGREVRVMPVPAGGASVKISDLHQPRIRQGLVFSDLLPAGWRRCQSDTPPQRLYNFRAVVQEGSLQARGEIIATFDFHLLCEVDFHWARAYHLQLKEDRAQTESVAERAEGSCPLCQEVRARLKKDWRYEV